MADLTSAEYMAKQSDHAKQLLCEGVEGITLRDTLPNSAYPLKEEAEAIYFKERRELLNTTYVRRIMDIAQDICEGENNAERLQGVNC